MTTYERFICVIYALEFFIAFSIQATTQTNSSGPIVVSAVSNSDGGLTVGRIQDSARSGRFGSIADLETLTSRRIKPSRKGLLEPIRMPKYRVSSNRGTQELSELAAERQEQRSDRQQTPTRRQPSNTRFRQRPQKKLRGMPLTDGTESLFGLEEPNFGLFGDERIRDDLREISRLEGEREGRNMFRQRVQADSLKSLLGQVPENLTPDIAHVVADTVQPNGDTYWWGENGEEEDGREAEMSLEGRRSQNMRLNGENEDALCICLEGRCMSMYSFLDFCKREPDVSVDCLDAMDYYGLNSCSERGGD